MIASNDNSRLPPELTEQTARFVAEACETMQRHAALCGLPLGAVAEFASAFFLAGLIAGDQDYDPDRVVSYAQQMAAKIYEDRNATE